MKSKEQRLRSLRSSSWVSPVARLSSRSLPQSTQISKAVNPGAVTILPARLQRIAAYEIKAGKLEALLGVVQVRAQDIAEHIRLATARRAGACASQKLEIEIRLGSVVPMNRKFVSDLLNVRRFEAHEIDLTTFDLGETRAVVSQEFQATRSASSGQTARSPSNHSRLLRERSPKIAVPMRTSVAPSSTAIGKSFVIPMDRWGSLTSNSFSSAARNLRSRTKYF